MNARLIIAGCLTLILVSVLCVSATCDTRNELNKEKAEIEQLKKDMESLSMAHEELDEKMFLLDAHVKFFINGGWK